VTQEKEQPIVEEPDDSGIFDIFGPKTRLCILLKSLCRKKPIEKEDFVDRAADELEDYYGKGYNNARKMVLRYLAKFEEEGLIQLVKNGEKSVFIHLGKIANFKGIGLMKIGKVFQSRIISVALIISVVIFLLSIYSGSFQYIFLSVFYLVMMMIIYLSYDDSFIFK